MPPKKKVCSDKSDEVLRKMGVIRDTPGACYKKGVRAGFAGAKQGARKFTKKATALASKLGVEQYKTSIEKPIAKQATDVLRAVTKNRENMAGQLIQLQRRGISKVGISTSRYPSGAFGRGKCSA
jgi:hypothetical protein